MTKEINDIINGYNTIIIDCHRFCNASTAAEFQIELLRQIDELRVKVVELKNKAIDDKHEPAANMLLSLEKMLEALAHELRMWLALKDNRPRDAWKALIQA